jgi:hypothetical protein
MSEDVIVQMILEAEQAEEDTVDSKIPETAPEEIKIDPLPFEDEELPKAKDTASSLRERLARVNR